MKKPSERIKEIADLLFKEEKNNCFAHGFEVCKCNYTRCRSKAVVQYLDEQYEKNRPCEHEWELSFLLPGTKNCKKCKIVST